jgi:hypothetical protein
MGRSRRRARTAATAPSTPDRSARPARPVAPAVPDAPSGVALRRALATYLAGALVLAVLVLLGTVTLAGTLGPWIVLAVAAAGATGLYRWATSRLAGAELSDEDRTLRTMAGGLLVLLVAFAAVAAVVLTVA